MNYKRINNITGWIVCIIACTVYIMTMEATGSLWDCGEFASCAYKLQIPHPPGAPLFVLIGRLFMIPFNPQNAATGVNLMSALSSGFTILFLFWSITHFAKKMLKKDNDDLNSQEIFSVMAAGFVGALAYCFSDSFWYSAVESEVYALSSFFTAIVFWAVLKWEDAVTEEQKKGITGHFTSADRWLILIFYLMGLSIGVHLLNLLTIPAAVMVYYFKRYKVTTMGTVIAFIVGCAVTGIVQKFVIQYSIKGAGSFDILFKNDFGLPFFTGFAFFFVFLAALIYWGLRIAKKNNWNFLKLSLWCTAFMMLGYTSYFTTLLRSNADPVVDMYNVDNPVSLVGYLSREQYGETPIMYGPDFTAGNVAGDAYEPDVEYEETYIKTKNGYEKKGKKQIVKYNAGDEHIFPRMWDAGNEQGHAQYYADFAGITKINVEEGENGQKVTRQRWDDKPSFGQNVSFFTQYQVGWMYFRYFMWNFAGKQNDVQGVNMANKRDGNWKSGIGFIDNLFLGDQDKMPDSMKNNKANNKLYFLPLILGIFGLIYQYKKDRKDALITGLLFFFTGLAIVVYLNMPGNMPRERDYAFVGSFYAFAIWIGLGVLFVKDLIAKFASSSIANYAAAAICTLAVPVLMASQEWDDHDRGKKTLARDLATDYLESCAPNAIVISFGDNDTYPLWYAQEVEGVRKDVRVINSSLLGIDWYINQLRYKLNNSDPIDPIWSAEQIEGSNRDIVLAASYIYNNNPEMISTYYKRAGVPTPLGEPMDLYTMMKDFAGSDDMNKSERAGSGGSTYNLFPTNRVTVPVDTNLVRANGTVNADDQVLSQLQFDIPKNIIQKNDAAILNIIAANKWKRPIYFTSARIQLGFDKYIRQDGMTYRLVPVENGGVNKPWVEDKMMNKFAFGAADRPGVYFDEENRRHLNSIRLAYASAAANLAASGKTDAAKKLLEKCDKNMLESNFSYGMVSRDQQHNSISLRFLDAAVAAGDTALASKVTGALKKDLEQQMIYYAALNKTTVEKLTADADSMLSRQYRSEQEINYLNYLKPQNFQQMINQRRYQQSNEMTNFQENLSGKLRPLYDEVLSCYQILESVKEKEKAQKAPVAKSVESIQDTPLKKPE